MESLKKTIFLVLLITLCITILFVSCSKKKSPTEPKNVDTTVTDIDGNVYQIVQIGNQYWTAENLKVTHYRNGDAIPYGPQDNSAWISLTTGAYCLYDDNAGNATTYGNFYNAYAILDSRKIAPEGWHVPSDEDWKELERYLGMSKTDANTEGWRGPNQGNKLKTRDYGTNESGFSALLGGYRSGAGSVYMGVYGCFWSTTEDIDDKVWSRYVGRDQSTVYRSSYEKCLGYSVRLVMDN